MRTNVTVVTLLVGMLAAACGAPAVTPLPTGPTSSGQPTQTGQPTGTGQPISSGGPTDTQAPEPSSDGSTPLPGTSPEPQPTEIPPPQPEPLVEPELETPEEVAEALFNPDLADQAVVSMLALLGIGTYKDDGTPIRPGTEADDDDLYLFEYEVRALIDMLERTDTAEDFISFRDYYDSLVGLGYEGTLDELLTTYADAYANNPTAQMSQYIGATAFLEPEAQFTRFGAWLLFVDGFVTPNGSTDDLVRSGGAAGGLVAAGQGQWGISRAQMRRVNNALAITHLTAVINGAAITVSGSSAHEGHRQAGTPATMTGYISVPQLISPLTGNALVLRNPGGGLTGIPITWEPSPKLYAHGTLSTASGTTNSGGEVQTQFIPQREAADGVGYIVHEPVKLKAKVSSTALINALYSARPMGALVRRQIEGTGVINVAWHVKEAIRFTMDYHYDVEIRAIVGKTHAVGDDSINGILVKKEDGTWEGFFTGRAVGDQTSTAFGRPCTARWDAEQELYVTGREAPDALLGDFILRFEPAWEATGNTGRGRCPPTRTKLDSTRYAPFGDAAVQSAGIDEGLVIIFPHEPGGTQIINKPALPRGTGIIVAPGTKWTITTEFLDSP